LNYVIDLLLQSTRKNPEKKEEVNEEEEEMKIRSSTGLVRSGRIFGGLINDIKRKAPWYTAVQRH